VPKHPVVTPPSSRRSPAVRFFPCSRPRFPSVKEGLFLPAGVAPTSPRVVSVGLFSVVVRLLTLSSRRCRVSLL